MEDYTLWIDFEHLKCYRVPNTLELAEGPATLYTLAGQAKRMNAEELAAWEIPLDEIQTSLQTAAFQFITQAREKTTAAGTEQPGTASIQITSQSLSDWIKGLADALDDTLADDETRLLNAQEWIRACRLKVLEWGIPTESVLELWPNVIRASYKSSEHPENFHQIVEWLRTLSARLSQVQAGNVNDFIQALTQLNQLITPLFAHPETEEERKRRYQKMAREAMPPIPTPDFKELIARYKAEQ